MRKLLYAFVFASILVLAGFTSFASPNEPSDGGTVPPNRVWLPVVEGAVDLCRTSEIRHGWWGSRYPDSPRYYGLSVWLYGVSIYQMYPVSEPTFVVARDQALTDIVASGGDSSPYSSPWDVIWEIYPGFKEEDIGDTYYTRFSFRCEGELRALSKNIVVEDCHGCIFGYTTRARD